MTAPGPVALPGGETVAALGQGTENIGCDPARRAGELAAVRAGVDLGLSLIDTSEIYSGGLAEALLGEALLGRRDQVFLVSKVAPDHSRYSDVRSSCEESLRRLRTDRIDLYLLHWPTDDEALLEETFSAFESLAETGKIRYWGVSNFSMSDLGQLSGMGFGDHLAADQVLYNLRRRGVEADVLPWCRARQVAVMAYAPLEKGAFLGSPALQEVAAGHGATTAQVALAWLVSRGGVVAIPKASTVAHVRENHAALSIALSEADLAALDGAFPAPPGPVAFEMM